MKIIFVTTVLLINGLLLAQTPAISEKYTDAEIETLIKNFNQSKSRDLIVTGNLLNRFQQDFPNAKSVEWETNDEIYNVEFEVKSCDFDAYYDKDGNLLMYKHEIKEKELPAVVKTAATSKYPKYRFEEIEKRVIGKKIFYKIEMELKDTEVDMIISEDGKFL
jgi:hypothetical protein